MLETSSSPKPRHGEEKAARPGRAFLLALTSVFLFSALPVIVHEVAGSVNPFIFSTVTHLSLAAAIWIYLRAQADRCFGEQLAETLKETGESETARVRPITIFRYLLPGTEEGEEVHTSRRDLMRSVLGLTQLEESTKNKPTRSTLSSLGSNPIAWILAKLRMKWTWLWLPILWMILGRLDYAFFLMSARNIETAVSTVFYEFWPIGMVIILARISKGSTEAKTRSISNRKRILMLFAFIGLAIVILSQDDLELGTIPHSSTVLGLLLAALSGTLASVSAAANLRYGDLMAAHYAATHRQRADIESTTTESPGENEQIHNTTINSRAEHRPDLVSDTQNVWLSLAGLALASVMIVPINLLLYLLVPLETNELQSEGISWFIAAIVLGTGILGIGSFAFRQANLDAIDLGVNSLYFVTPVLAILWLGLIGISLQNPELLWIGAALVFSMGGLIEANPDQEPDYVSIDSQPPLGTRLGFTSLILSIWLFGTIVYFRDDAFPSSWLSWSVSEYWSLVGLSATIFALILGFRVQRLTDRLTSEDKEALAMFRQFERLVGKKKLPRRVLTEVRKLDTARPQALAIAYENVREILRDAYLASPEDGEDLFRLQDSLDAVAHSKQQGKDLSELISIFIFAAITVALVILGRPDELNDVSESWSAFLIEMFGVMFVATIVFLAFLLIDMRRDRQIPLIVPIETGSSEYTLFFRHKTHLKLANVVSVMIVLFLVSVFSYLLYTKWSL